MWNLFVKYSSPRSTEPCKPVPGVRFQGTALKDVKRKTTWVEPSKGRFPPLSTFPSSFFFPAAPTFCRIPNFKRLEQARAESAASSIYKHLPENSQSSTLAQRSIPPLHKSRRNHRFYVSTSSTVFVPASNLSATL